ncbi:protein NUCLEAR FUSION DEFECTIVE 2 isoform X2 [Lycium barbarum]|uniref:protein NUCLEAR FUSION DEFECTIVE 2 isoform X2 n=1 Tax=Lycium barbarum TaxID=112863 RepID=UPI00293E6CAF|nr:protein NUCLEAR FUSION DEFECTIVE 2 isoform X2 [Lycium barbarum]
MIVVFLLYLSQGSIRNNLFFCQDRGKVCVHSTLSRLHLWDYTEYVVVGEYTFQDVELLRRAMTHASYSGENNRALSILGEKVIEGSVSLQLLSKNIDMSPKDLNRAIVDLSSNVVTSCVADGERLDLQKIIRVSRKTNSSAPAVVCGAFRAMFGAIAIDKSSLDSAGKVFLSVHGKGMEKAVAM